eukprot:CAMPEP_0206480728 /NCGR_PEP_ID=MMETSP0324_2-20121206/37605_1 /ASSEMBLY_ACC=CAM_ASM_000836 /TAXON_ID=2866 /ORGANISM="Crypthecodinium cohnii, Strain Seligo" /LENGTH=376 /DNA_ID=CAMNT_0053957847 /DNA_START=43 /DNA_END=1170 /DNA_ORIENTATION=+
MLGILIAAAMVGSATSSENCPSSNSIVVDDDTSNLLQVRTGESGFVSAKSLGAVRKTHICSEEGRALPVLIGGVQKTGSSTTFDDLVESLWLRQDMNCSIGPFSDGSMGGNFWACKEMRFLDRGNSKEKMLAAWGPCSPPKEGLIADFDPENFHVPYVPTKLVDIYGPTKSKEIVFLMGLREPLERMLSAFANGIKAGWIYHHTRPNMTFQEHVTEFFVDWEANGGQQWVPTLVNKNDYQTVDDGLYFNKVQYYLDAGFLPSQFIVYPCNLYMEHRDNLATNPVLKAVRERLGDDVLLPKTNNRMSTLTNGGQHDSLDDALSKPLQDRLQTEVFEPANQKLMSLLSKWKSQGMTLVGYTGEANDIPAITAWMKGKW